MGRAALLLMSIFLFGLVIHTRQQQQQEEIDCFVDGSCEDSPLVDIDVVSNAEECLLFCNDTLECQYFTYDITTEFCFAYSECVNFTTDSCPDCITGNVNCTDEESPLCYLPGTCDGVLEEAVITADQEACRGECLANDECQYFSYDSNGNKCLLLSTCEVDEGCMTCVHGKRDCITENHDLSKIIIIGGFNTEFGFLSDVEIVDMSSISQNCVKPPNYPVPLSGHVTAMIDNVPWVCGGMYINVCYNYDYVSGTWQGATPMNQNRYLSAADLINGGTDWWITGGLQSGGARLDTTEILSNGNFDFGPDLPAKMHGHCLVTINNTHVFLAGGNPATTNTSSSYAYIIDFTNGEGWQPVNDMSSPREMHSCNLIETEKFGPEIVVMGGPSATTEIFTLGNLTWRTGPNFPSYLQYHQTVPYKESFLIIGGFSSGGRSDFIYCFNTTTWTWKEEVQTMALPRDNFAALMLEEDMTHCG